LPFFFAFLLGGHRKYVVLGSFYTSKLGSVGRWVGLQFFSNFYISRPSTLLESQTQQTRRSFPVILLITYLKKS